MGPTHSRNASADAWIIAASNVPGFAANFDTLRVTSDLDYVVLRNSLSPSIRDSFDIFRLRFLVENSAPHPDERSLPVEAFAATPEGFRALPASLLPLSVRAVNCLRIGRLETLGQIADRGSMGLARIPNCGKKTRLEIAGALWDAAGTWLIDRFGSADAEPSLSQTHSVDATQAAVARDFTQMRSLNIALRMSIDRLPTRSRDIVSGRLGLSGAVLTLGDLGTRLGVTRERVRQLEASSFKYSLAHERWPLKLQEALLRILSTRTEPAWLVWFPMLDPFFEGFEFGECALERVIDTFGGNGVHCFKIDGVAVCARISGEDYEVLRLAFQDTIKSLVGKRPTRLEIEIIAESLAMNAGVRELRGELVKNLAPLCHFARPPGVEDEVLVAFGRGVDQIVVKVLEESEGPLHYGEVHRRAQLCTNSDLEIRRVHNALNQPGVFLFGRGTFGLRRHLNADSDEIAAVQDAAEEVVLSGDPDRQWHADEILEQLPFDSSAGRRVFTPYDLNIILSASKRVRYLNRMVWVADSSSHRDSTDRIDIAQACARLLREAGRPLTRMEILEQLRDWRGTGRHFQLHGSPDVVSISPGVWGLRGRDLPLSAGEVASILDTLHHCLITTGKGLHQSELSCALANDGLRLADDVDSYWILSLAGTDARFRVFYGGYVGLGGWPDSRRLTLSAAGRMLAQTLSQPVPADELRAMLSDLLGRETGRADAVGAARGAGFTFDRDSDLWQAPIDSGEEE